MNIYGTMWCKEQLFVSQNDAPGATYSFNSVKRLSIYEYRMRKRCRLHVNIPFIERENVTVERNGPSGRPGGTPVLGSEQAGHSDCSQTLLLHQDPWAALYRRRQDKQMGEEAGPRHQLFCCLEEIFANILIRSRCATGNLTFPIMLIPASTSSQKNTVANQKFCGEQRQNGDVVNGCVHQQQWRSRGHFLF